MIKKNLIIPLVAVAAVVIYLATKGDAPWWSKLALSDEQRDMLENQEREFWPVSEGNTAYPVAAMTGTNAPKVWI